MHRFVYGRRLQEHDRFLRMRVSGRNRDGREPGVRGRERGRLEGEQGERDGRRRQAGGRQDQQHQAQTKMIRRETSYQGISHQNTVINFVERKIKLQITT